MKKVLLAVMMVGVFTLPSFSLLKIDGVYTQFANASGVGAGLDLPLIPFIPTSIFVSQLADTNITLGSFTIGGTSFSAGSIAFKQYMAELQLQFPIGLLGVDVGACIAGNLATADDGVGHTGAVPGNVYGGVYGKYSIDVLPLIKAYGQVGYLVKVVDGQRAFNEQASVNFDLSKLDQSGLYYRAGVSVGF